jgi:hypothetical protein
MISPPRAGPHLKITLAANGAWHNELRHQRFLEAVGDCQVMRQELADFAANYQPICPASAAE